jgi:hypothetical protein
VDTTVQEKAISHPTDAKLYARGIRNLTRQRYRPQPVGPGGRGRLRRTTGAPRDRAIDVRSANGGATSSQALSLR